MTISQSKIGEIENKFTRRSRTVRSIQKYNKKGHGLKTVVSDFLPEIWSKSVRFTLISYIGAYTCKVRWPILENVHRRIKGICKMYHCKGDREKTLIIFSCTSNILCTPNMFCLEWFCQSQSLDPIDVA
jgi:hypothetical protein